MLEALVGFARRHDLVPRLSETERQALEAGDVWFEGDVFSGRLPLERWLTAPYPTLGAREQAFLDGPVEELCALVDDWQLHRERELRPQVWAFLREHGFFGLTLPERWGGLGFSTLGLSAVVGKLASRSMPLSAVVVIPNSVGPGELLLEHGTPEQQQRYLPRLARGEEIPCFALTEPEAGSDAAAIRSRGRVERGADGRLQLRLDWDKRYITLAPLATLIGLAVRLEDEGELLGQGRAPGITCVLVPATTPGVEIGARHDPMGLAIPNGPTRGRDVVVGVEQIVGGAQGAGRGWRMLMEALAAGRGITLPAQAAGGVKALARIVGAYAGVRRQFGLPIGRFEGIEEPLARIGGLAYAIEAARVLTCGAVDAGVRPSVVSSLMKHRTTEIGRALVCDAMDVVGGAGICRGPRNLLALGYTGAPIAITVEGANILTRTLILFGQAVIRAHPWARREIAALDAGRGGALGVALAGHAGFSVWSLLRATVHGLTRGWIAGPGVGPTARLQRRLAWSTARFAALANLALVSLGPQLKRRGKLTGRFADVLSWTYLAVASLRRFEADGRRREDLPVVTWAVEHCLANVQEAFEGILANFDGAVLGSLLRGPWALLARVNRLGRPPADVRGARVAALLRTWGPDRERLYGGIHVPRDESQPIAALERALRLTAETAPAEEALRTAVRAGRLPDQPDLDTAVAAGVLSPEAARHLTEARAARRMAIEVDAFPAAHPRGVGAEPALAAAAPHA